MTNETKFSPPEWVLMAWVEISSKSMYGFKKCFIVTDLVDVKIKSFGKWNLMIHRGLIDHRHWCLRYEW